MTKPTEPDWKDIEEVIRPFVSDNDSELARHIDATMRLTRSAWNDGAKYGWIINRKEWFKACFGHLRKILRDLKKAEGDPERACRIIFDHEEN